jgi:hypothetical protein
MLINLSLIVNHENLKEKMVGIMNGVHTIYHHLCHCFKTWRLVGFYPYRFNEGGEYILGLKIRDKLDSTF